jgi:hypothetical protein
VEAGFFPLDEELGLLLGHLTPHAHECLVRLGTWMPFEKAADELSFSLKVTVSEPTARRYTQEAGAAQVDWQTQEVDRLEREAPPAPPGPAKLYLSADGAFVPLVGGEWAEVKTVVIGEVGEPVQNAKPGEPVVHTRNLSYFSRLAEAETLTRLALVETHRRGVENARQVGAVMDGAEWLQGFVTWHRPDAVRTRSVDFPHAGGYVAKIGQAAFGADTPELAAWLKTQLHTLKHDGPDAVLVELRERVGAQPEAEALALPQALAYLEKRRPQMDYPAFQAQGWPIGSGATESGNKLVVEARLKGAGMHWARAHVDPMLALRNIACNDRWAEAWPHIAATLRQQARARAQARRQKRREARPAMLTGKADEPLPAEVMPPSQPVSSASLAPALSAPEEPAQAREQKRIARHRTILGVVHPLAVRNTGLLRPSP